MSKKDKTKMSFIEKVGKKIPDPVIIFLIINLTC